MKLGSVALAVATKITYRFNFEKDKCWWTIKQLAEFVQCTERQVYSAKNIFEEKKLFFITKGRTGKANEYKPNFNIILKYPSLLDEKMRQRAVNYLSPQTINTNNKLNSSNKKLNGWGKKSVESSYPIDRERNLKDYVGFVKRGQHTTWLSDDMVKQMYDEDLITEEEYKKW